MTTDIVAEWEALLPKLYDDGVRAKDVQRVPLELDRRFGGLSDEQRLELEPLLARWVLSDDRVERAAGISLVRAHRLESLAPALRELQQRLETSTAVGSSDEWDKVNRVLGQLRRPDSAPASTIAPAWERSGVDPRFGRPMLGDMATQWERWYPELVDEAGADRPYVVATTLSAAYAVLAADERGQLAPLLRSWLLSDDDRARAAALALASEHGIASLAPALHELLTQRAAALDAETRAWASELHRRLAP